MRSRDRWIVVGAIALAAAGAGAIGGLALSRDDGMGCLSEKPRPLQPAGPGIESVTPSASGSREIYVTTKDRRLFVGTEGRRWRWRRVRARAPGALFAAVGQQNVLLAGSNALYRSANHGASWARLTCGLSVVDVSVAPADAATIYLATAQALTERKGGGLYRSVDSGKSWQRFTDFPHPDPDQTGVEAVKVDPKSSLNVYVGREFGGLDYSTDGGTSWSFTPIAEPTLGTYGPQITSLAFAADGKTLWIGSRLRGVFSGTPSSGWTARGLGNVYVDQVLPDLRRASLIRVISHNTAYRTSDGGTHWQIVRGLPRTLMGMAQGGDRIYAWTKQAVYLSRDNGQAWRRLPNVR